MIKKIVFLAIVLFPLLGCGQKSTLTQTETELLKRLDFNSDLITKIKELTKTDIKQLPAIDRETGDELSDKYFKGIFSETTGDNVNESVVKLKAKFRENGYLVFVYEGEDNKKNIAVINGQDELDILRFRRTDGINYGLENEDVVQKISEWKNKYGLVVIGCSRDWLHVEFDNLPLDIDSFAKEVYAFCPDSVDQGVGTISKLKQAIIEMKGVWLWWD